MFLQTSRKEFVEIPQFDCLLDGRNSDEVYDEFSACSPDVVHQVVVRWLLECVEEEGRAVIESVLSARPDLGTRLGLGCRPSSNFVLGAVASNGQASSQQSTSCEFDLKAQHERTLISEHSPSLLPSPRAIDRDDAEIEIQRMPAQHEHHDIVEDDVHPMQFLQDIVYCMGSDREVRLRVIRLDELTESMEVSYRTMELMTVGGDLSAANKVYRPKCGVITFPEGVSEVEISIEVLDHYSYTTTRTFAVELVFDKVDDLKPGKCTRVSENLTDSCHDGGSQAECAFKDNGSRAYVRVMDSHAFPSNQYQDQIKVGNFGEVPGDGFALLWEYIKVNWSQDNIRAGTMRRMIATQILNINLLVELILFRYLVDHALRGHRDQPLSKYFKLGPVSQLAIISFLPLFQLALNHQATRWKLTKSVGGPSRRHLQIAMLQRALRYTVEARAEIRPGQLSMAMSRDTMLVVTQGYNHIINLTKLAGKIIVLYIYFIIAPFLFNKPFSIKPIICSLLYPALLLALLIKRNHITKEHILARTKGQDRLVGAFERIMQNADVFRGYNQYWKAVVRLEGGIGEYNKARREANIVMCDNRYFCLWVTHIFVAIVSFQYGIRVLQGELTVGIFLTYVRVVAQLGAAWGDIHNIAAEMRRVLPSLERLSSLLSRPTDLVERWERGTLDLEGSYRSRDRRVSNWTPRTGATLEHGQVGEFSDSNAETIKLRNLFLQRECKGEWDGSHMSRSLGHSFMLDLDCDIEVKQGSLVCIVGGPGCGKSTILKMIAGLIPPDESFSQCVEVPRHLSVHHADAEPSFLPDLSLYENLVFGAGGGSRRYGDAKSIWRVRKVCEMVGVSEDVQAKLNQRTLHLDWNQVLSQVERSLLNVVRALVADAEVLCMQKPTLYLDEDRSRKVFELLNVVVRDRGVGYDASTLARRRPRTCIITSSKRAGVSLASQVIAVQPGRMFEATNAEALNLMFSNDLSQL